MAQDKLFYVGQKAFIEKDGAVLILTDPQRGLDFPGGKIQDGETDFVEALKREVLKETNLEIEIGVPFCVWSYTFPPDHRNQGEVFLVGYRCTYRSGEVRLSDEHIDFRWVTKSTYQQLANQNDAYYRALKSYFD